MKILDYCDVDAWLLLSRKNLYKVSYMTLLWLWNLTFATLPTTVSGVLKTWQATLFWSWKTQVILVSHSTIDCVLTVVLMHIHVQIHRVVIFLPKRSLWCAHLHVSLTNWCLRFSHSTINHLTIFVGALMRTRHIFLW